MLEKIPLGRFGQPIEVASVVAFLASDLAATINSEIVAIDGGYIAQELAVRAIGRWCIAGAVADVSDCCARNTVLVPTVTDRAPVVAVCW